LGEVVRFGVEHPAVAATAKDLVPLSRLVGVDDYSTTSPTA
jgi:hypothetical protein